MGGGPHELPFGRGRPVDYPNRGSLVETGLGGGWTAAGGLGLYPSGQPSGGRPQSVLPGWGQNFPQTLFCMGGRIQAGTDFQARPIHAANTYRSAPASAFLHCLRDVVSTATAYGRFGKTGARRAISALVAGRSQNRERSQI